MKSRVTLLCAIAIVAMAVAPWVKPEPVVAPGPLCTDAPAGGCTAGVANGVSIGAGTLVAAGVPRR